MHAGATLAVARLGASQERLGGAAACAVKRTHLDARMAWKARDSGAELREGFEVGAANPALDRQSGLWTVESTDVSVQSLYSCSCVPPSCYSLATSPSAHRLMQRHRRLSPTSSLADTPN